MKMLLGFILLLVMAGCIVAGGFLLMPSRKEEVVNASFGGHYKLPRALQVSGLCTR